MPETELLPIHFDTRQVGGCLLLEKPYQDDIWQQEALLLCLFQLRRHELGREQVVPQHSVPHVKQVSQVRPGAQNAVILPKVRCPRHLPRGKLRT